MDNDPKISKYHADFRCSSHSHINGCAIYGCTLNPWLASYRFGMERHLFFGFQQCHVFAGSLTIPWPSIVHKNMNWFKTVLLKERELCVRTQLIAAHFESLQKAFRAGGKPCRSEFRIGFRTLTAMWSGWRTMCALSPAGVGHCIDLHLLFPDLLWLQRGHKQVLVAGPRTEGCLIWWCFVKHLRFGTCYDLPWFYHVFMASYWLFIMMSRVLPVPRPFFPCFTQMLGMFPAVKDGCLLWQLLCLCARYQLPEPLWRQGVNPMISYSTSS